MPWNIDDFGGYFDPGEQYDFTPSYTPTFGPVNLTDYFTPGEVDYQDYYAPTTAAAPPSWQGYNPGYTGSAAAAPPSDLYPLPDMSTVGKATPPSDTPVGDWFGKVGGDLAKKATDNPFSALLALGGLGTIGAGLYSSAGSNKVQAPKRTLELTPQEQALATRATASLPDDPNRQRLYAQIRQAALERVRRDLGPGGEYSTPGQEYLKRIEEQIMADQTNRQVQDISIAQGGLRDLSQLANTRYTTDLNLALANAQLAQQRGAGLTQLGGTLLGIPFGYNSRPATPR